MPEPKPKRTGIIAVALLILGAIGSAAAWTYYVDKALPTWLSWLPAIGAILPTALAWLFWIILIYCATALLTTAFREWRHGKRAQKRAWLSDLESLLKHVKSVRREAEMLLGSSEARDSRRRFDDFSGAVFKLREALAESGTYDGRVRLHAIVATMDRVSLDNRNDLELRHIEAHLNSLREWAEWAGLMLNPKSHPKLRDPMESPSE